MNIILKRNIQCGNTLTNRKYIEKRFRALSTEDTEEGKENASGLSEYEINLFGTHYNFNGENITMIEEQLNNSIQINVTDREYAETHYLALSKAKITKHEDEQLDLCKFQRYITS